MGLVYRPTEINKIYYKNNKVFDNNDDSCAIMYNDNRIVKAYCGYNVFTTGSAYYIPDIAIRNYLRTPKDITINYSINKTKYTTILEKTLNFGETIKLRDCSVFADNYDELEHMYLFIPDASTNILNIYKLSDNNYSKKIRIGLTNKYFNSSDSSEPIDWYNATPSNTFDSYIIKGEFYFTFVNKYDTGGFEFEITGLDDNYFAHFQGSISSTDDNFRFKIITQIATHFRCKIYKLGGLNRTEILCFDYAIIKGDSMPNNLTINRNSKSDFTITESKIYYS